MGEVAKKITYVGSSNTTTHTIPIPTHLAGELVVLVLSIFRDRTVSFTNGSWTQQAISARNEAIHVYTHTGAATPLTSEVLTFNVAARCVAHVYIIPDGDTTTPISGTVSTSDDASPISTPTGPNVTPSHNGCVLFTAVASGNSTQTLAPQGWFFGGAGLAGSDVRSICAFNYQATASATGTITWPYGSDDIDNFTYVTFAVKCNTTTVSEARCSGTPSTLEHNMGLRMETDGITVANLTATITTINGQTTNYATPGAGTAGQLIDGYLSTDLSINDNTKTGQYLMYATPWVLDKDYRGKILSVGVIYTGIRTVYDFDEQNLQIGLFDNTNDAWRFWSLKAQDSIPGHKTLTNIIIDPEGGWEVEDGGTGDFDTSVSLSQISHLIIARRLEEAAAGQAYVWMPIHSLDTMTIVGGNATRPASFSTCFELAKTNYLNSVQAQLEQATGQFYVTQSLSIGDGSTTTVWDSTGQSVEYPGKYSATTVRVQPQISEAAFTLTVDTSCTMTANTLNMGDYHNLVFKSGTVTGSALVLSATLHFDGSAITGWTFSSCKGYADTIAGTLTNCVFDSLPATETEYFTVSTEPQFNKLVSSTFRNASGAGQVAVEITGDQTGTWTTDPNWTVSGNTYDIRYTGATNFTIESANALTVTNTGAGVLTIDTPTQATRINPDVTISDSPTGSIRYFRPAVSEQTPAGSGSGDFLDYTYTTTDPIDIEVVEQGYVPVNQQNVTPFNGTLNIEMDLDEAYNASHSLTIVTHYTFDRGTKNFNFLADQNAFDVRSSMADTIRTNSSYFNTPLLLEAKPGGKRIDLIDGATITSMETWKGAGMERYDALGTIYPIEKWYSIQSVQDITGASVIYRQTNSGDFTIGALTGGKFDETLQFYSDTTVPPDNNPETNNDSYLLIKALRVGYRQARNDVVAGNGGASLKADLYTIGLAPSAHDYAGNPATDLSLTMTLVAGGTVGGKTFSYKWVDAGTNLGTDIADWINYKGATDPNGLIPGSTGLRWAEMPDMVIYNGSEIWTANGYREGATPTLVGFYVERGGADHPDFAKFESDTPLDFYTPAQSATATISNFATTSRLQIYDTLNAVELYNGVPGATSYQFSETYTVDRDIRVRITNKVTTTASIMIEATVGSITAANPDVAYIANQSADTTYNNNAVDGDMVTGITINDTTDRVEIGIAGGSVPWKNIYAYQVAWLHTEAGIRDDFAFIDAPDTANYILTGFKIKNTSSPSVPLVITGGYGRDATTGASIDLIDTTGGSLFFAPDHVIPYATGSGVTSADKTEIIAGVTSSVSDTLPDAVWQSPKAIPKLLSVE